MAYVGPTFTQAKRIAWQYLKDYAAPYLSKPPQESELKLTLKNDATIHVLGADNADSLRGMYLDGFVGDEYAMFRPMVFSQVIRPALSDRNGWGVFASTPRGKNLFWELHKFAQANPLEWYSLSLKATTSGIMPMNELEALRRQMDPEEFAQEYECSFDAALKGAIYAKEVDQLFADHRVISVEEPTRYDPLLPTNFAYDLGFTDSTVYVAWQEHKDGSKTILKCEATSGMDIFEHIDRLHSFSGELGDVWLPHDARAKNLQTGKSVIEQFLSEGIRPSMVPAHKVRDGIAAARKVFPSIYIEEAHTGELVEALKNYRREWDEDMGMFKDKPVHDWASDYADAFRYMCIVLDKQTKTYNFSKGKEEATTPLDQIMNLDNMFDDREHTLSLIRRIG